MLTGGAQCDKCGRRILWEDHRSKGALIKWLRQEGWSVGKGNELVEEKTLCPDCRKKRAHI